MNRLKQTPEQYSQDVESRFSNFTKRVNSARNRYEQAHAMGIAESEEALYAKNHKGKLLAAAAAGVAAMTLLTGTHKTLGEGIMSHMPHEGVYPTNPAQNERMNLEHANLTGEPLISNNK
jgi:hypothetical protein